MTRAGALRAARAQWKLEPVDASSGNREYAAPRSALRRMLAASFGQARRTPLCPDEPRLGGRLALVTGATGGIGLEIARGSRAAAPR